MQSITWHKHPSVTTGGKPHFYQATDGERVRATVVWDRAVLAYRVEVDNQLRDYVSTANQGKHAANRMLADIT